jgi:hypothetical protein
MMHRVAIIGRTGEAAVKFPWPLFALALPALADQAPADAQELLGAYAISLQTTCQIITSGTATLKPGGASNSVGVAVFIPGAQNRNAGIVEINETVIGGPTMAPRNGTIISRPLHATVAYSNSPTALTVAGVTYNAAYSNVQKGVAGRVFFNGVLNEGAFQNTCLASGLLQAVTD